MTPRPPSLLPFAFFFALLAFFLSPSYTHRPFGRGRCVGRGSGAGGRIPTNSFVWEKFQIDSRAPNRTPQNGQGSPHRANDQVPPRWAYPIHPNRKSPPSPPMALPYTSQIQKTTKSRDNPPDGLTLHMPAPDAPREPDGPAPRACTQKPRAAKPPDRLTLHLPYTCPHRQWPQHTPCSPGRRDASHVGTAVGMATTVRERRRKRRAKKRKKKRRRKKKKKSHNSL